jgi:multiple sugar transport system permease protein
LPEVIFLAQDIASPPGLDRVGVEAPGPPRRRWRSSETLAAVLFLLPALFGFTVFYLVPLVRGVILSLTDWDLLSPPNFVGLQNFQELFSDRLFWNSLLVTAEYVILNIGFQTILAILIAVLMERLTRSMAIRGSLIVPYLIPNIVVGLIWFWMLDLQLGIVNQFIEAIGLNRIPFLGSTFWALPSIAFINVWRHMGYTALLVFAGLQAIPKTAYEAAAIDGASEWKMFWKITMPLLRPVLAVVLVITMIGSFQIFDTVAVTTKGGPVNATRVIYYYIYQKAFDQFEFGYASAIALVLMLILVAVTFVQLKLLRAGESDLA